MTHFCPSLGQWGTKTLQYRPIISLSLQSNNFSKMIDWKDVDTSGTNNRFNQEIEKGGPVTSCKCIPFKAQLPIIMGQGTQALRQPACNCYLCIPSACGRPTGNGWFSGKLHFCAVATEYCCKIDFRCRTKATATVESFLLTILKTNRRPKRLAVILSNVCMDILWPGSSTPPG